MTKIKNLTVDRKHKKKPARYKGRYIDYRIIEYEGKAGFASVIVNYTYLHSGTAPLDNGNYIYDEKETSITPIEWIEKFKNNKMIKTKKYDLPVNYDELQQHQRRAVRLQYMREQNMNCYYCKHNLRTDPPKYILKKKINWDLFPKNFLDNPVHLHHHHDTGMTIGAVHAFCNAALWQYHKE